METRILRSTFTSVVLCLFSTGVFSQASVTEFADPQTIICGGCASLSAFGSTIGNSVFLEDFNSGSPTGWAYTNQAMWNNPCSPAGVDGTTHIWMGDNSGVPRILETVPFDFSTAVAGANVCFDFMMAEQVGDASAAPCEGPDEPDEGVYLQYSTDGGTTWVTFQYFDPNGGYDDNLTNWNNWCFPLPPAALTANTIIRWYQDADSGEDYDHWGIDNVQIYMNDPTYEIIWVHDGYNAGYEGGTNPTPVCPTVTTVYTVMITNGIETYYDDITITVVPPDVQVNAGNDTSVCAGECIDLNGFTTVIVSPAKTPTYENNEFEIVTSGAASVNINITDLNMTTVLPGSITEVCINSFSYSGTQMCTDFGGCDCNGTPISFGDQCDLDASSFNVSLISPTGCQIELVPSNTAVGTDYLNVCFIPSGGGDIHGGGFPASGSWDPEQPFDNMVGCQANGVWTLDFDAGGGLGFGLGQLGGWSISFDDPEISYTPDFFWSPTTNMTNETTLSPNVCPTGDITYTLSATDTAGCVTVTDDVLVTIAPVCCDLSLDNVTSTDPSCGSNDGTITITSSGGTPPVEYSIDGGSTFQASNSFTGLGAGTYNIVVQDAVCDRTSSVTLASGAAPTVSISNSDNVDCAGACNGTATVSIISGTANFNYYWENSVGGSVSTETNTPSSGSTIINLCPDTYYVTVVDASTCPAVTSVTITEPGALNLSGVVANASAPAVCDGSINITVTGGSPAYSYSWSTGPTTEDLSAQCAGTYTVTVTDANGCTLTDTYTITEPSCPMTVTIPTSTNVICAGDCDGTANAVDVGGQTPVSYSWTNSSTVQSPTNLCAGIHTVTVTDANLCTATASVTITEPSVLSSSGTATDVSVQGNCDGAIDLVPSGGVLPYIFSWDNSETTEDITGLCVGTYNVTITDANNCTTTNTFTINSPGCILTATVNLDADASCAGICDGAATVTPSNGLTPYTYLWTNGSTLSSPSDLCSGNHTITITDAGSCVITTNITIGAGVGPSPNLGADIDFCFGESAILDAGGGYSSYIWSGSEVTQTISVNSSGNFAVSVTDVNGCIGTDQINVTVNPLPVANAGADQTICQAASANLTASGGVSYLWETGETTTNIIVTPAVTEYYAVTVTDGNGCSEIDSTQIIISPPPIADAGADQTICISANTILTASGGVNYLWSTSETSQSITVAPVDTITYYVTVTDAIGCTATDDVIVNVSTGIIATITATDDDICKGDTTQLQAGGGITFQWNTTETTQIILVAPLVSTTYYVTVTDALGCTGEELLNINVNSLPAADAGMDQDICIGEGTNLTAGGGIIYLWNTAENSQTISVDPSSTTTYTVTVTDINGCSETDDVTITVNPAVVASINNSQPIICEGNSSVLGATGGIGFLWDTGVTTQSIIVSPVITTNYSVTVTDVQGCTGVTATAVTVNPPPTAEAGTDQTICYGAGATLVASGGSFYVWSNGETIQTTTVFPTSTTTYFVTVTDNSCASVDSVIVTVIPEVVADINATTPTICEGQSTILQASGGTTYTWSNGETTSDIVISPPSTTTYSVTVVDANGCLASTSIQINVSDSVTVIVSPSVICVGESAQLTASAGTSYMWSTAETTQTIDVSPVITTNYSVTVTDSGCTGSANVTVTVNDLPVAYAGVDTTICQGGDVSLTATGGTSFEWSTGAITATISVSPTTTSNYFVTVTDNGCSSIDWVSITVTPNPVADAGPDQSVCDGTSATLTASGGDSYIWSTGESTQTINVSPLSTTSYIVTVVSSGCATTDEVIVTVNNPPNADAGLDQTICPGDNATLTATGGSTYEWNTTSTNATIIVSPMQTTSYFVTVSQNGCSAVDDVTVTVNNAVTPAISASPSTICETQSSTLTASGGTAFQWSTGESTQSIDVTPLTSTTYYVTVTSNGCSGITDILITVNPGISATSSPSEICEGESTILTVSAGSTYIWSTGATTQTIVVSPTISTTYYVTVSTATCEDSTAVPVTVNSLPNANAGEDADICMGESVTLIATGGATYVWNNSMSGPSISVSPGTSSVYTVTVTSSYGCESSDDVMINVHSLPSAFAGPDQEICEGDNAQLNASGGVGYIWSPATGLSTANIQNPVASPGNTIEYTVTVFDQYGCSDSDDILLTVNQSLTVDVSVIPYPSASACSGDEISFTALPVNPGSNPVFEWKINDLNVGSNSSTFSSSNLSDGDIVSCTLYSSETCAINNPAVDFVEVSISEAPKISIRAENNRGCAPLSVLFTGGSNINSTYYWVLDDNIVSTDSVFNHVYENTGIYEVSVIVTSEQGCSSSMTFPNMVEIYDPPEASFYATPDVTTLFQPVIDFTNLTEGSYIDSVIFGDGDSLIYFGGSDFDHEYLISGNFNVTLIAYSIHGCIDTTNLSVLVRPEYTFYAPTAITPTADNVNDRFYVLGTGIDRTKFEMYIFDRWGENIFYTRNYDSENPWMFGWDGTAKNGKAPVQVGCYSWVVIYQDIGGNQHEEKGNVTVIR